MRGLWISETFSPSVFTFCFAIFRSQLLWSQFGDSGCEQLIISQAEEQWEMSLCLWLGSEGLTSPLYLIYSNSLQATINRNGPLFILPHHLQIWCVLEIVTQAHAIPSESNSASCFGAQAAFPFICAIVWVTPSLIVSPWVLSFPEAAKCAISVITWLELR